VRAQPASADDTTLTANIAQLGLNLAADTTITWWVAALSGTDTTPSNERWTLRYLVNAIGGPAEGVPVKFGIASLRPVPFNSQTVVRFGIEQPAPTTLKVYDILGREVAVVFKGAPSRGWHQVVWDARDKASGLYVLRLESGGRLQARKAMLIR
jgi:hypothetical protein